MKGITRMLTIFALVLGLFHPLPGSAATSAAAGFCYKAGDYYDKNHTGWHVIECWNEWGDGWVVDIYYIKHGTEFQVI